MDATAGFSAVGTRPGLEGGGDKLVLIAQLAKDYSRSRVFHEKVLSVVRNAGNAADAQAKVWCEYVEQLPYRRESDEVIRDPIRTAVEGVGGDCDDLVVALLAGLRTLAIPAMPQILATPEGNPFHVRVLVGLPPTRPQTWVVVDPVWRSEREWAMVDREPGDNQLLRGRSFQLAGVEPPTPPTPPMSLTSKWSMMAVAAGAVVLFRKKLSRLFR